MFRDISLHILDLTQNSIKAGADHIKMIFSANISTGILSMSIQDNGCGMSKEFLASVEDPFTTSRTTRKVGMGIPFFKLACIQSGGDFTIFSEEAKGTQLNGTMKINNVDRIPMGNLGETIKFLILGNPEIRYILVLSTEEKEAVIDTDEIKKELGDVPIDQHEILEWIEEFINESIVNIFGGILNEINGRA